MTCIRGRILVWEDGFCNFAASSSSSSSPTTTAGGGGGSGAAGPEMNCGDCSGPSLYGNPSSCDHFQHYHHQGLQPELFFKMSHEIYNYGEGYVRVRPPLFLFSEFFLALNGVVQLIIAHFGLIKRINNV